MMRADKPIIECDSCGKMVDKVDVVDGSSLCGFCKTIYDRTVGKPSR